SLEFVAHRFAAVPQPPLRGAGIDREAPSDSPLLRGSHGVRDSIHLPPPQLETFHLSVMPCTLCIHHRLQVLTRSARWTRTARDAQVTEHHRLSGPGSHLEPWWPSSGSANYRAGFR